jgi:hypothetical protein
MTKVKHGMCKTTIYKRWIYMKGRCSSDAHYLARGIAVCDRWLHSFENFYQDMGDPPTPKHTLDRIDGNKGYSPENCRWATYKEQNRNLSTNVWVDGELISDIAVRSGVHRNTVHYRRSKGLPLDEPSISVRTHCKAGHPWTDENTYVKEVPRKQGGTRMQKYCRACRAKHQSDLRLKTREANESTQTP